jgi:hypothetical protein
MNPMITLPSGTQLSEQIVRRWSEGFMRGEEFHLIECLETKDVKYLINEWLELEEP